MHSYPSCVLFIGCIGTLAHGSQWRSQNVRKCYTHQRETTVTSSDSSIASLFIMGTALKGKNLLPEGANSFLLEQFLMALKSLLPHLWTSLECYYFYYAHV